jgi:hypothetical protein
MFIYIHTHIAIHYVHIDTHTCIKVHARDDLKYTVSTQIRWEQGGAVRSSASVFLLCSKSAQHGKKHAHPKQAVA